MSTQVIVYVLTALAAVVVVLTRLRLGEEGGAGRHSVGHALVNAHTVVGVLALVTWVVVLVAPDGNFFDGAGFGIVSLAFWWALVVLGLLILVRWLPSHGKHASEGSSDTWSDGPGLSILGHVGMLVGVCVFTLAYLQAKI